MDEEGFSPAYAFLLVMEEVLCFCKTIAKMSYHLDVMMGNQEDRDYVF